MNLFSFTVGYSDSYIDLNWRHNRAIILKAIEMPQFDLSQEARLDDYTETYESKYYIWASTRYLLYNRATKVQADLRICADSLVKAFAACTHHFTMSMKKPSYP